VNWTKGGSEVSDQPGASAFTMPDTENVALVANFVSEENIERGASILQALTYALTLNVYPPGSGTVWRCRQLMKREWKYPVSANPAEGYSFVNWTLNWYRYQWIF
jgi:hypothetical protein